MMKFLSNKLVKSLSLAFFAGLTVTTNAQNFNWSPAGPIYTAGRARNMLVDKTDASGSTLYVGSTTSGIFRSSDAGANWFPLNDQATVRNISYLAQSANNTIFVGTGEGFLRPSQAAKAQPGTGLYKLVGNNLVLVKDSSVTSTVINRVACHPFDANILAISTKTAVLFSVDGGSTFITANTGTFTGMGQDVKFDISGNLYFSIGPVATGTNASSSTVWKSNGPLSASSAFTDITPTSASVPSPNFGRIEIAIAPSNPNVVYVSCANKYNTKSSATLRALFVSYDATSTTPTWGTVLVGSSQLDPLSNGGTLASGDYAHTILVDPSNSDHILMGGYTFYSFTRTGGTNSSPSGNWIQAGSPYALGSQFYLHENIHDIKIIGSNPIKFYFVTDAGIYRSIDLVGGIFPSFQPFYKGLVTGQFNSVSIDRFPSANTSTVTGTTITPNQTYIGGTGGNGLTYFSGNYPNVSTELSYESGDIFNSEYSKILPKAAYFSSSSGSLFRTADVTTGNSNLVDWVVNTKKQDVQSLTNSSYSLAGTPFKMWENIGTSPSTPDSLIFYNDTAVAKSTIPTLTASTSFSFSIGRPQPTAIIDYITVRAGTVVVAATPSQVAVNPYTGLNTKTLTIVMNPTYTANSSSTVAFSAPISTVTGYAGAMSSFSVILNPNNLDNIYLTLAGPLFTANPTSAPTLTNVSDYLRLSATVYYRYPASSTIKIVDNSISTKSSTLTTTTPASGVMSWNSTVTVGSSTVPVVNPVLKVPTIASARLAMPYASGVSGGYVYSIRVTNSPLDLNTPLSFVNVSQDKCLTDDSSGNPTTNTVNVNGRPTVLEWGKSGKNLYYATDAGTVSCLYRVSHLYTLVDSTAKGYNGKQHTNVFTYSTSSTPNPRCPYRTTLLGTFPNKITSISVPSNDTMGLVLTFNDASPTGTLVMVSSSTANIQKADYTNIGFADKTPTVMANRITYCSLLEMSDPRKTYVGTDNGIFYTSDITAATPSWMNINAVSTNTANWLPNVQIFDIKQQTLERWNAYNSGQIFVATNGRGIWINSDYYVPTVVSVNEIPKTATTENNLTLYPNPTNGNVNVSFNGVSGETAKITVYDVNGRIVKTEDLGKIYTTEVNYIFETTNIATGLYIIHVSSDAGIKRVAKLVVTK